MIAFPFGNMISGMARTMLSQEHRELGAGEVGDIEQTRGDEKTVINNLFPMVQHGLKFVKVW